MKAIRIHEDGGPEVLRYEDVPDPEPGPGEVLVSTARRRRSTTSTSGCGRACPRCRSRASSVRTAPASSPALGDGVDGFAVGDRVVVNPGIAHGGAITVIGEHTDGTHCELKAIPADAASTRSTTALSFEEAAAFPLVVRDGVPDARHEGRRSARANGC